MFNLHPSRSAVKHIGQHRFFRAGVRQPDAPGTTIRLHDDGEPHFHEYTEAEKDALSDLIEKADSIELTTVGIDIGSSTSHLMFAKVRLQRKSKMLSSGYVVVSRTIIWKSPILLTPFLPDNSIDAAQLGDFIQGAYRAAGLSADDIDSGAVILTGEAIKRNNAEEIAQLFAAESGKFVCASAGHHLECMLAAHGSGAAALSKATHRTVLNVDIGGGTTKFALIKNGIIVATFAIAVGGRLIVRDSDGRCIRIDEAAQQTASSLGLPLELAGKSEPCDIELIVDALAEAAIALMRGEQPSGLTKTLLLTEGPPIDFAPDLITFSGGVSEYLFGRESTDYGDIAKLLAGKISQAFATGRVRAALTDPGNGIRATVIGASQFTVQVSGKTIHLSRGIPLPLHNIPVIYPRIAFGQDLSNAGVMREIQAALTRRDLNASHTVAVAIRWRAEPYYATLRTLAAGIAAALDNASATPLILMFDGDVGKTVGNILEYELKVLRPVISIDGVQLDELDFVDVGSLVEPAFVIPIVIKSLLFTPA